VKTESNIEVREISGGNALGESIVRGAVDNNKLPGKYFGHACVVIYTETAPDVHGRHAPYFATSIQLKGVKEGLASHALQNLKGEMMKGYGRESKFKLELQ